MTKSLNLKSRFGGVEDSMRLKYSGFLVFFTCLIISCGIVQAKDKVIFIQAEASITCTISENMAGSVASKLGSGICNYVLCLPEFVSLVNKNFVIKNVEGVQSKGSFGKVLSIYSDESELLLPAELGLTRQAGENLLSIRADYVVTTREPYNSIPVFESRQALINSCRDIEKTKLISHPLYKNINGGV